MGRPDGHHLHQRGEPDDREPTCLAAVAVDAEQAGFEIDQVGLDLVTFYSQPMPPS